MAKRTKPTRITYSERIAAAICERLADGETLRAICETAGMPGATTVRRWAMDPERPFSARYKIARELGYHKMADDILDVADDGRNDWMDRETRNGTIRVVDDECVRRSELRVNTRKWLLAKALPKIYGDKVEATHKLDGSEAFLAMLKAISGAGAVNA
jgi:hypothetical protein